MCFYMHSPSSQNGSGYHPKGFISMSKYRAEDAYLSDICVHDFLMKGQKRAEESNTSFGRNSDFTGETITVEYRNLSIEEACILRSILRTNRSVKKVTLRESSLTPVKVAFENIKDVSCLEELNLINVDCDSGGFTIHLTEDFSNLHFLRLECDEIGDAFTKTIAKFLRDNRSLEMLTLCSYAVTDEGAIAIAEALRSNTTLRKLTLERTMLSSRTLLAFAEVLIVNPVLELVHVFEVDIKDEHVSLLFEQENYTSVFKRMHILWEDCYLPQLITLLRQDRQCSTVSVSVSDSVPGVTLREFFDALAENATVENFYLYPTCNRLDTITEGLVHVLRSTTSLQKVHNFVGVDMSRDSLVKVLDALKENHSVKSFMMQTESLTPEIVTSLSQLLASNNTLNEVSICECYTDGLDVSDILSSLKNNYTLRKLMIAWEPGDDMEGLSQIKALLNRNASLLNKAVAFVKSGGVVTGDAEGADALHKLRCCPHLVDELQELTGKSKEAVRSGIDIALATVSP